MGIEVVHDEKNLLRIGISVDKIFDILCPIQCRPVFADACMSPPSKRLTGHRDTAGPVSDIFAVLFPFVPRFHRKRLSGFSQQLIGLFIHTDYKPRRIIWKTVNIQDIFHTGYEFCVFFRRDTPVVVKVWL